MNDIYFKHIKTGIGITSKTLSDLLEQGRDYIIFNSNNINMCKKIKYYIKDIPFSKDFISYSSSTKALTYQELQYIQKILNYHINCQNIELSNKIDKLIKNKITEIQYTNGGFKINDTNNNG